MPEPTTTRDSPVTRVLSTPKRLNLFERYLSVWVALCMVAGVAIGKAVPEVTHVLRGLEFGRGSRINGPIAVLIWLMITPMMSRSRRTTSRARPCTWR